LPDLRSTTKWRTATTNVDGPFTETKEVIGGYAILEAIHGDEWDIECEVRPLEGPQFGKDG
jgi:hypothetical protein